MGLYTPLNIASTREGGGRAAPGVDLMKVHGRANLLPAREYNSGFEALQAPLAHPAHIAWPGKSAAARWGAARSRRVRRRRRCGGPTKRCPRPGKRCSTFRRCTTASARLAILSSLCGKQLLLSEVQSPPACERGSASTRHLNSIFAALVPQPHMHPHLPTCLLAWCASHRLFRDGVG